MAIRSFALSTLAAAALAGCGTTYDEPAPVSRAPVAPPAPVVTAPTASSGTSAPTPVALASLQAGTFRPGNGILESIGLTTLPASAAAGGTATPTPVPGPYRLTIRMEDGSIQTVQADTRALLVGDRVQITQDGRLVRP
jgi:hypothetical protein